MRSITVFMGRDYVPAIPYASCIECGNGTRSHVIREPIYEPYLQETRVRFEGEEDGDVPTVQKWELSEDAEVMCHKCWVALREKTFKQLKRDGATWIESPLPNSQRIKSFLKRWQDFAFDEEMADPEMNEIVEQLKESIRRAARGE